jgi:MFS family permease
VPAHSRHRSPWLILCVILLTTVAASLNQFKVPPILPLLMDAFHMPAGQAGLLMSVFAVTGLVLAFPVGFISQKLGYRSTGVIAVSFIVIGAAAGALSKDVGTMLGSRFLEGAGMSVLSIICPALVALWFTEDRRGKAMGIFATWVPVGSTIMFLMAPVLAGRWGWRGVWWFGCFYALLMGLLYVSMVKPAPREFEDKNQVTREDLLRVLRNRDLWLISFLFGCFNFVFLSFVTWSPTFLFEVRGQSLPHASFLVSLISLFAIVSCPLSGWISDKLGSRKQVYVLPMVGMTFLLPLAFYLNTEMFLPYVIAFGLISGFAPTGVFAAAAEVVGDERLGGLAMAIIQVGQNSGMLLGPVIFGWMVESMGGWEAAFWTLAPVSAMGAGAGWIARGR